MGLIDFANISEVSLGQDTTKGSTHANSFTVVNGDPAASKIKFQLHIQDGDYQHKFAGSKEELIREWYHTCCTMVAYHKERSAEGKASSRWLW